MTISMMGEKNLFPGKNDKIVLTIGNFDGFHLGHQKMINEIRSTMSTSEKLVVLTFRPHPRKILGKLTNNFLLTPYNVRNELLMNSHVDAIVEIPFSRDLSNLSPNEFVDQYILVDCRIVKIYIGHDFCFGANKKGNFDFLNVYLKSKNILVQQCSVFRMENKIISSSSIRSLLSAGNVEMAGILMGRPHSIKGSVIKGKGRGKIIGFPTANMDYDDDLMRPSSGVYVTRSCYKGIWYNSITNIGPNPTFESSDVIHVETHFLDFDMDIYGELIETTFLSKIREEKKFTSANELIHQIKEDVKIAEGIHAKY